ncbi:DUF4189 domain-containing protein [Luteibacter sp. PPL201]|uniref:DUF4189 domain-containing protein n=1 Tax=Luteibacter sahnii TaxID=3021977 RepID=A0ABT6B847_9GAMM
MKKIASRFVTPLVLFVISTYAAAAASSVPAEVLRAAPPGSRVAVFTASGDQAGADAVAIYESAPDASGSRQRHLVVFHKENGAFRPVVSSDAVVACSTCSPERDDPLMGGDGIKVTPGHIEIGQVYGSAKPTSVMYRFDFRNGQWRVTSASREESDGRTVKLALPASGLLADFDGQWQAKSFWNALALNDKDHSFYFLMGQPSEASLNEGLKKACDTDGTCRVVARVANGCLSLARDASGASFAAATPTTASKDKAKQEALSACQAQGKGECQSVRTSCSAGPIQD